MNQQIILNNYQVNKSLGEENVMISNFQQFQNSNFTLPGYRLNQRNSYKPFKSNLRQFDNRKDEGIYVHKMMENYLNYRKENPLSQTQISYWINKFGSRWIYFVIEKIIFYMQNRGLTNYKAEYTTTNSGLTKKFDVVFYNDSQTNYSIVDWKYSDFTFEQILKMDSQHFKDQLFEAIKQFNTSQVTIMIVPLKQIHNFTIQEITAEDLLKIIKSIPNDQNQMDKQYKSYVKQISQDKNRQILLQQSEIGVSKQKNEYLLENINQILKLQSEKQINYYLNLNNLNSDIQPRNKFQFWVIHVFLKEIIINKNLDFQQILFETTQQISQQNQNQNSVIQSKAVGEPQVVNSKEIEQQNQIQIPENHQIWLQKKQERGYSITCFEISQEFYFFAQ